MEVIIYDPSMCCSTGLCGPSVDEKLVKINEDIQTLKEKFPGIEINRYMISTQPLKFARNRKVLGLVKSEGSSILPITTVNGEIIKTKEYPSYEEMASKLEMIK